MDRAIKEVVAGIVQRSVSIASQTTKELVLKVCVFACEYVFLTLVFLVYRKTFWLTLKSYS